MVRKEASSYKSVSVVVSMMAAMVVSSSGSEMSGVSYTSDSADASSSVGVVD